MKAVELTGWDVAGNSATATCGYTVAYRFLGFLEPMPQTSHRRGSRIPVKFRLGDATGTTIPDAEASALAADCLAQVTFDGTLMGCAAYDPQADIFQFDLKLAKDVAPGSHQLGIHVTAVGGGVVNVDATSVVVR